MRRLWCHSLFSSDEKDHYPGTTPETTVSRKLVGLTLEGAGVVPESVALRDLAAFLEALDRLVCTHANQSRGKVASRPATKFPALSLVGLEAGSAALRFSVDASVVASLAELTRKLDEGAPFDETTSRALDNLTGLLGRRAWTARFHTNPDCGIRAARLSPPMADRPG